MRTRIPQLGETAVDVITRFKGIVTGRCEYISGCTQLLVQPQMDDKGVVPEARWIDEQRLGVDIAYPPISLDNSQTPGSDMPAPIR